jgi:YVTN family beta-propeller protein
VAVSPDGRHAYITNLNANSVSVIDTGSNTVSATIPIGIHPHGVALSPDGRHVYVTNEGTSSVSVIEPPRV